MKIQGVLPTLLFAFVALLSFSVWAVGSFLYRSEPSMYALCALVFFGLGGLALSPAVSLSGRRSCVIFCLRFAAGFSIYALLWSVCWFHFRDTTGEVLGSFFGLLGLVAVLRGKRAAGHDLLTATAIVFLWHTLGYYLGGLAYQALQNRGQFAIELPFDGKTVTILARFSWGLFYGLGLGYGLTRMLHGTRPR